MPLFAQTIPVEWWPSMAFAALGSFSIGFVEWARVYQHGGPKPRKVKDPVDYLIWAVVHPMIAAGLAAAYRDAGQSLSGILAFQIGVSAPLIIRQFATSVESPSSGEDNPPPQPQLPASPPVPPPPSPQVVPKGKKSPRKTRTDAS